VSIDDSYLEQTIARHVIFGDKMLLNDGYLVMHPLARRSLLAGADSVLFNLMAEGYVRILSTGESIAESIVKRAESGVDAHRQLVESADWRDMRANLDFISKRQANNGFFHSWPSKDMTDGFLRAISRCRGRTVPELGLTGVPPGLVDAIIDDLTLALETDRSAARTKWERIAKQRIDNLPGTSERQYVLNQIMGLANEAYHTNFAACLAEGKAIPYGVETRQSPAFDELFGTSEIAAQRLRDFQPIHIPNHPALRDSDKLRRFTVPGEAKNRKEAYLSLLERFLANDPAVDAQAHDAARLEYIRFLARHFEVRWEMPKTRFMMSLYLFAGSTIAGLATDPLVGASIGGLVFVAENYLTPILMKKIAVRDLENALRDGELGAGDIDLRRRLKRGSGLASITLDPAKATELAQHVRSFS
jgi:hypothetical protein